MENGNSKILKGLNQAQYQAVTQYDSPSLIVAGAGSGKTRVLTCRIAYMIEQGVQPSSILALTFTNKAAREMRERIASIVGDKSRWIWMGTFHSVFAKLLYMEAEQIGYRPSFTIYDTSQSQSLIKTIIKELNLSDEAYKPKELQSRISLAKNNLVTADAYQSNTVFAAEDREHRRPEFGRIYKLYAERCKANNAMDFDDLLLNMNILFRDHKEILERYRQKFRYILVDEYQDTNYAQYLILRNLAQGGSKICVVGDDAQSIYSFRGAKIENIFRFRSDFPDAQTFKLEQNYRSTQTIVNAANSIIEKNAHRIKKSVFSQNETGEKIKVLRAYTDGEEAQMVADGVRSAARENGGNWSEIAILYRTNAQSRSLEEALRRRDVPYRIFGGHSFYDRKEIKDLLAYFKLIINPRDDESLTRVINYPARGIGDVTVARIKALAQQHDQSMWEAISSADPQSPEAKAIGKRVFEFAELIKSLSLDRNQKTLYEFGLEVATRSGIIGSFKMTPSPDSESALANIEELLNSMQDFKEQFEVYDEDDNDGSNHEPGIEEWLHNISLMTDMDSKDADQKRWVTLMTVHAAKGLEFDTVFIVGLEENLFPSLMSLVSPEQLEEERRLFYVALTRAKRNATISFAQSRYKWGNMEFCKPSRFIGELDQNYLDICFDDEEDGNGESLTRQNPLGEFKSRFERRTRYESEGSSSSYRSQTERMRTPQSMDISQLKKVGGRKVLENSDETAVVAQSEHAQSNGYKVGQKVRHPKFGIGEVSEIEFLASDLKITVIFADENVGKKSLLNKYAKLETVE